LDCGWLKLKVCHFTSKSEPKTDEIGIHQTISVASRPLDILHMGLISDVAVWCWLLVAHWCQAMPIFGLQYRLKVWHFASKSDPKLIPLVCIKPYQLPPDHWISSILV
jgi:hypothetical protein